MKFLFALVLMPAAGVMGQDATPRSVISIQPLSAIFQTFAGEYEHAAGKAVTWGIGATYWNGFSGSDFTYISAEFKLRYYPNEVVLQGFSFGGSLGFTTVSASSVSSPNGSVCCSSASGPSFGVLLEYQWLMGQKKNFAVALGLGAKALAISADKFSSSFLAKYPTARISIGYAF